MTAWTQDLIYAGDPVHYHGSRATEGTLSWRQATAQAGQGGSVTTSNSAFAYPDNSLSRWGAPRSTCQLLPKAKAWLAKKMPQWRRILQGETGKQPTRRVCGLSFSLRFPLYRSAAETAVYL